MTWLLMASTPCSGLGSRPVIQHSWKVKHCKSERQGLAFRKRQIIYFTILCSKSKSTLNYKQRWDPAIISNRASHNGHCHLASLPLMAEETINNKTSNILQLEKAGILLIPSPIWNAFKSNVFCWVPAGICNLSPYLHEVLASIT